MNQPDVYYLERSFFKLNVPFTIKLAVVDDIDVVERILDTASQLIVDDLDIIDDKFSPMKEDSLISKFHRGDAEVFFQDDMFQIVYNQSSLAKIATGGRYDAFAQDCFDPSDLIVGWAIETEFMKHLKPLLVDPQIVGVSLDSGLKMQVATDPNSSFIWNVEILDPDDEAKLAHYQLKNGALATSSYNDEKFDSQFNYDSPRLITLVSKGLTEAAILADTAIKMNITDAVNMIEASKLTGFILPSDSEAISFLDGHFSERRLYALKNSQSNLSQL